tara:strand:+ start:1773 stop:1997 length:225 start_codon:yes stop_codon:yes gene_type:complete
MFSLIPIILSIVFLFALFYGFIKYILPVILIYMLISYIGRLFSGSKNPAQKKDVNKNKDEYSQNIVDVEYEEVE